MADPFYGAARTGSKSRRTAPDEPIGAGSGAGAGVCVSSAGGAVVPVFIGQAGNQIGHAFLTHYASSVLSPPPSSSPSSPSSPSYTSTDDPLFAYSPPRGRGARPRAGAGGWDARAVLVDMEPKVVAGALDAARRDGLFGYTAGADVCEQSGSANNWAYGYNVHGVGSVDRVIEAVRVQAEAADTLDGLMVFHSCAGGTGSGLGARATVQLRDAFGDAPLFNLAVMPYDSGEVIVQNYNTLLTLSSVYAVSDGVVLIANDDAHAVVSSLHGIKAVSFDHINAVIGKQIAQVMLPSTLAAPAAVDLSKGYAPDRYVAAASGNPLLRKKTRRRVFAPHGTLPSPPLDTWGELCSHPAYKLLAIKTLPQVPDASLAFTSNSWAQLLKHARQMLIANAPMEEGIRWSVKPGMASANVSVANALYLRGSGLDDALPYLPGFMDPALYAPWTGAPTHGLTLRSGLGPTLGSAPRSATLLTNSQVAVPALTNLVSRADDMIASGAYIHHYDAYGVSRADLEAASLNVAQIASDYASLSLSL